MTLGDEFVESQAFQLLVIRLADDERERRRRPGGTPLTAGAVRRRVEEAAHRYRNGG